MYDECKDTENDISVYEKKKMEKLKKYVNLQD